MEAHKKTPCALEAKGALPPTGNNVNPLHHKDNIKLPRIQRLVYNLLLSGGKYSVADISISLHLSDPRSHIAELRKKGITIYDEWLTSEFNNRYKRYWIREGV